MNQLKINDTNQVLNDIKELIVETKNSIQSNLNSEMVILYWNVGRRVRTAIMESEKAQYGKEIVDTLSRQLKLEYGRGYSRRNLFNMIKLYDMFPSEQKVQTLSAQLIWSHLILLMKYDDPIKIQFYISMVVNEM